jgi:chaperonin GroES
MVLNIKPLSDRVLIEPVAAETKLPQGFYPRHCKEKPQRNCCSRGNGTKEHTMTVKLVTLYFMVNMLEPN